MRSSLAAYPAKLPRLLVGLACACAAGCLAACATSAVTPFTWTAPDGSSHRAGRVVRAMPHPRGPNEHRECDGDADCSERPGGICASWSVPAGYEGTRCAYDQCSRRRPCKQGLCVPPGVWGSRVARCVRADCRRDADCQARRPGGRCRYLPIEWPGSDGRFTCVYPDDPCDVDRPCPSAIVNGDRREQGCAVTREDGVSCRAVPEPAP